MCPAFCLDVAHPQLDLAEVPHPGKTFRGRDVLIPRGKSWAPWLAGQTSEVHDANAIHGWEREPSFDLS